MASKILNSWAVGRCLARRASAVRKARISQKYYKKILSKPHDYILYKYNQSLSDYNDLPKMMISRSFRLFYISRNPFKAR